MLNFAAFSHLREQKQGKTFSFLKKSGKIAPQIPGPYTHEAQMSRLVGNLWPQSPGHGTFLPMLALTLCDEPQAGETNLSGDTKIASNRFIGTRNSWSALQAVAG